MGPIRFSVIEMHTGLNDFFLFFGFFKDFGYFDYEKYLLWLIRWCWIRNFTNQSIIEIFDPTIIGCAL